MGVQHDRVYCALLCVGICLALVQRSQGGMTYSHRLCMLLNRNKMNERCTLLSAEKHVAKEKGPRLV